MKTMVCGRFSVEAIICAKRTAAIILTAIVMMLCSSCKTTSYLPVAEEEADEPSSWQTPSGKQPPDPDPQSDGEGDALLSENPSAGYLVDLHKDFTKWSVDSEGNKFVLEIQANTFQKPMDVEINANEPEASVDLEELRKITKMEPVTNAVVIHFSELQTTLGDSRYYVKIPIGEKLIARAKSEKKNIFAMIRTVGFHNSNMWTMHIGTLEKKEGSGDAYLRLPFIASPAKLTALGVLGPKARVLGL